MDEDRWRTCLRWVVVHPHDPAVLMARRDGALALPETERPGRVWTAEPAEVLPALGELLGADALLLDCLDDHEDPAARVQRATLVAVPRQTPALPPGMAWVGRDGLAGADAAVAARVIEALERPGGDGGQPWAARGWFAEAEGWLRSAMERLGRPVTGTVRQARVWRLSCVLRAPAGDGDVWFKANTTSPLFVNEGPVMGALAGLFPARCRPRWPSSPGAAGWSWPTSAGRSAGRRPSRWSRRWPGPTPGCRYRPPGTSAGCLDRRLDRLAAQAQAWLPAVEATAELPGIDPGTWLSPEEEAGLRAAAPRLQARRAELARYAVPPSIVHGDLHLSNVARGPKGHLFFDWTDACVAHPFLDLATIRRGTAFVDSTDEAELRERLGQAYLPEWAAFEPPGRLAEAWELAAPLGALHQAVSYRSLATRPPGTPTWPSRPPGGCVRCWPAWRDRRHPGAVPYGTAGARPGPADLTADAPLRGGEMELETTRTVLRELIACPEPGCGVPAGIVDRFVLPSTAGPVEHVKTWCLEGHGFTQRVDALVPWPMVRARRPLETG